MFIFFFILTLCLPLTVIGQKNSPEPPVSTDFYGRIINYLHWERTLVSATEDNFVKTLLIFVIDLFFSSFCLWVAILFLTASKMPFLKTFPRFLLTINLAWFIILLVLKALWESLDFLVIQLQPELFQAITDHFSFVVIVIAVSVYIWLLSRVFGLTFLGSLGVFFFSHLIYFTIIFLCFTFIPLKENKFSHSLKANLGFRPVIQSYLSDVNKISSSQSILSYIRIRAFHL